MTDDPRHAEHARMAQGCPTRHCEATVEENPKWMGWYATAAAATGTGCLLILCGDRGSGKTQLATELVRDARMRRDKAKYTTSIDFFLSLREAFRSDKEAPTERKAMEPFVTPKLLVIDEIHERGGSEWEDRMLRYVIDKRYGDRLDTVVIGNLRPEALFEQLGKSVRSRFEEIGTLIECVGLNWRKGGAGKGVWQ